MTFLYTAVAALVNIMGSLWYGRELGSPAQPPLRIKSEKTFNPNLRFDYGPARYTGKHPAVGFQCGGETVARAPTCTTGFGYLYDPVTMRYERT